MDSRLVPLDIEMIESIRTRKGWTKGDLAAQAPISSRTLDSIMKGNGAMMCTIRKLAKALGVPPHVIMRDANAQKAPEPTGTNNSPAVQPARHDHLVFKIKVEISASAANFDEVGQLPEILSLLQKALGIKPDVEVKAVDFGSVVITLELDAEDAWRLINDYLTSMKRIPFVVGLEVASDMVSEESGKEAIAELNALLKRMQRVGSSAHRELLRGLVEMAFAKIIRSCADMISPQAQALAPEGR